MLAGLAALTCDGREAYQLSQGERAMAYGHAERNLALIRQLEAETRKLLGSLDQLDPEQSAWLQEVTRSRSSEVISTGPKQQRRIAALGRPLLARMPAVGSRRRRRRTGSAGAGGAGRRSTPGRAWRSAGARRCRPGSC